MGISRPESAGWNNALNLYGEEKYSALSFLWKLSALCEASSTADKSASGLCGKQKYSRSIVHYALLRKTWANFQLDQKRQEEGIRPVHRLLNRTHPRQPEDRKKTAIEPGCHATCSGTLLLGVPRKARAAPTILRWVPMSNSLFSIPLTHEVTNQGFQYMKWP